MANAQKHTFSRKKLLKKNGQKIRVVVVVSALSGVTDGLISAAEYRLLPKNENYSEPIKTLEKKTPRICKKFIANHRTSSWLSFVKKEFQ